MLISKIHTEYANNLLTDIFNYLILLAFSQ